ncbi:hypothetical protein IE53DRAFT_384997 [Violaceomyces palustris]|uniref:Uncharacterized protein n=1 Tax=Violaceomyces palustris TaxID=1673888 RepID=A0ACD0P3N6_9BASI|nr:hypothetical protein IE53DRAFT_384997 [Violaceomyces palustris]
MSKSNGSAQTVDGQPTTTTSSPATMVTSPPSPSKPKKSQTLPTPSSPPSVRRPVNTRSRSSSFEKGAAVLRALSRAEADAFIGDYPKLDSSEADEEEGEEEEEEESDDRSKAKSVGGTLVATADPGEGLKRRKKAEQEPEDGEAGSGRESKQATDTVGAGVKRRGARGYKRSKLKQVWRAWEIPRKIFHSSIGGFVLMLYLYGTDLNVIVTNLSYFLAVVVTADVIRLNNQDFEWLYEKVLGFLMRESEKEKVNGVVWYLVGVIFSLHFFPEDIACVSIMILSWCDTCASTFGRGFGKYTPPLPTPPFASRKSMAGFIAAIVSGSLTAYLFWGTSIAQSGQRFQGLSWSQGPDSQATFGNACLFDPASSTTGWKGFGRGLVPPSPFHNPSSDPLASSLASGQGLARSCAENARIPSMPLWLLMIGTGLVAGFAEGMELGGLDDNLSLPILSAIGIWLMLWVWGKGASLWVELIGV